MSALSGRKVKRLLGWTGEASKLLMAAGKTLTVSNTLTLAGTDGDTITAPSGGGTVVTTNGAQTITNKTFTVANINTSIVKSSANQSFTSGDTGATLTNLTGLVQTVVPGTYKYRVFLPGVSTANSGMKVGFKLTTTVLTSIEAIGQAFAAAASVTTHTTTATDQATLVGSTTASLLAAVEGTMVVGTGGTIQVQGAQNASHADTTTFYLGGTFELTRIA